MNNTEWLTDQVSGLTDKKQNFLISELAEKIRIMPKSSPFPGPWQNSKTPYLVEPMNNLGPNSDTEIEVWLKGHQLGFTAGVENVIIGIIKLFPGPILYATASDELGKEWSENRFDVMLEQADMQNMIFSQTKKKNSKKTGDKTLLKEFPGGYIKITGYGSSAKLRSSSFRFFFGDEIDESKVDLKNQGDPLDIAKGRTSAFKSKRKIALFSTAVEKDASKISAAYELGDKRKFFVPCPFCGFKQTLEFHNLVYDVDVDGVLDHDSVKYKCQNEKCDEYFYNYHKAKMYESGECEWVATAKSKRKNYISRQMSCLYSPPGMITWSDVVQEYLNAEESGDPAKKKAFVTLYLGLPYEETGEKPKYEMVVSHRSNYKSGTVPEDVIFMTLGADVQADRIELEVCGHGRKFRTWSIEYIVINGDTESVTSGAWPKFRQMFLDGRFVYENEKGMYAPQMAFIDSHYREPVVVSFCETVTGLYPIIGKDKFADRLQKFKINSRPGSSMMSVVLAVNYLKDWVYDGLKIEKNPADPLPPGYPSFPYDYSDKYFKMLNAEYKRAVRKGSVVEYEYYCPSGRRNEALDCRCYAIGAREVLFHTVIKETLAEHIESYEEQVKRKVTPAEKTEFFYSYMEKVGSF